MKKICFHIQKGGVGKTSISCTIAFTLAHKGFNVILVDCDKQGNCSSWLNAEGFPFDIADVLYGDIPVQQALHPVTHNLSLLPVIAIGSKFKQWTETQLIHSQRAFDFLMSDIAALGFDYAILDCSPAFSQLEDAILSVCDEIINPLTPEFFSLDGIEIFTEELRKVEHNIRRKILNDKIVINMVNNSFSRHHIVIEQLKKLNYKLFSIPQDARLAECQIVHKSIYDYAPRAKSIPAFELLAEAL
jgi:cellulose biosynthesis protein BcsQ